MICNKRETVSFSFCTQRIFIVNSGRIICLEICCSLTKPTTHKSRLCFPYFADSELKWRPSWSWTTNSYASCDAAPPITLSEKSRLMTFSNHRCLFWISLSKKKNCLSMLYSLFNPICRWTTLWEFSASWTGPWKVDLKYILRPQLPSIVSWNFDRTLIDRVPVLLICSSFIHKCIC